LIPNSFLEKSFTYVKVLPTTTLLAVVEWETRLIPPSIEALIRTITIIRVTNKVSILTDHRAINTHVACFSALFTCHSGIDHFEMIEDRVLELLHEKSNLGSGHVHLFKQVNLAAVGQSMLIILALIRSHLLNRFASILNTESKE
jgi:hypothetical protein